MPIIDELTDVDISNLESAMQILKDAQSRETPSAYILRTIISDNRFKHIMDVIYPARKILFGTKFVPNMFEMFNEKGALTTIITRIERR